MRWMIPNKKIANYSKPPECPPDLLELSSTLNPTETSPLGCRNLSLLENQPESGPAIARGNMFRSLRTCVQGLFRTIVRKDAVNNTLEIGF